MNIQGVCYDGHSARPVKASLLLQDEQVVLQREGAQDHACTLRELTISDRLGSTPRTITFPDNLVFETADNDRIDTWLKTHSAHSSMQIVHLLEQHWRAVAASVLLLAGILFSLWRWGIPWTAEIIAMELPEKTVTAFGEDSLAALDKSKITEPSTLPAERQKELESRFARLQNAAGQNPAVPVHFRHFAMGPNAFALIDSRIVFTDEIVNLAGDDRELDAVLLHELGHLKRRHALRNILQTSSMGILWSAITGDASGIAATLLSGPAILAQLGYSRDFEREADDFAYRQMQRQGIPLVHFSNIMARMEYCGKKKKELPAKNADGATEETLLTYLSTHPASEERIRHFGKTTVSPSDCR